MHTTSYTTRVLTAESGHYLTQSADVPAGERAVTTKVYLAANADAADWREITAEEADAIRAAQAEAEP
jgi:hypothetical protein